jgi:hypothetical protein
MTFDASVGECTNCHARGSDDIPILDRVALDGLLHNVKIMVARLPDIEFQQLAGAFSPRPGHGAEDGIPFSEAQCEVVYQMLRQNDILCLWIAITADRQTHHSLILAKDNRGLQRGLRAAQKFARRIRAQLIVRGETNAL